VPAACRPAAADLLRTLRSATAPSCTLQFPWGKVSLGFAAAGLMTVAEPPSAACTATAVAAEPKVRRQAQDGGA
jgi:hypothetical protein